MDQLSPQAINGLVVLLVDYSLDLLGALALLIVGWVVSNWARRSIRRALDRSARVDASLKPIIVHSIRYAIMIVVFVAVLAQFGVQTTSVLALLGAAGLAVGLALQGTLSNVASGVMLLFLRPFNVGDYIDVGGVAGTVREIGLFATELQTYDGVYIMLPNTQIFGQAIKNYSRLPTRRVDVEVGVSYGDDVEKALNVAMSVLKANDRALSDPAPQVMVTSLGDSAVNLNLRCWTARGDYWDVFFELHKDVKKKLDAEGITIPFPQRDVHLIQKD